METLQGEREWASEEFGLADLGDKRRTKRLVQMAARAANQPAGQVTAVFDTSAAREGAFRLLENEDVAPSAIARASHRACARRASGAEYAFVAIDGTSLNLTDRTGEKGLGVIGARSIGARGLQVMTALAISPEGVPLGICGQEYWARKERSKRRSKHDRRAVDEKETRYWLSTLQQARKTFAEETPQTRPWIQLDRGGDAWPVLLEGLKPGELFTVRAAYDRRLLSQDEKRRYLWEELESKAVLSTMLLDVKALPAAKSRQGKVRPARRARKAVIEIRAARVSLDLCLDGRKKRAISPPLFALLALETAKSAGEEAPIEWMLLTSYSITTPADAKQVLFGYSQRWRIEEFHRSWKSGVCNVEHMQLRHTDNMLRWATVLAAVAVRVLRLTYMARHAPWLPATDELTPSEIDAIVIGSKSKKHRPGTVPPIDEITEMVATIGGYTGKSSGGPPGPLVVARGLLKIESLADALEVGLVRAVLA
jgi:hypothetical protein